MLRELKHRRLYAKLWIGFWFFLCVVVAFGGNQNVPGVGAFCAFMVALGIVLYPPTKQYTEDQDAPEPLTQESVAAAQEKGQITYL